MMKNKLIIIFVFEFLLFFTNSFANDNSSHALVKVDNVIDIELLYDHAMLSVNYKYAHKFGIKYIISGNQQIKRSDELVHPRRAGKA